MPAISDEKQNEVETLYQKGYSARQIAEHFHVSLDAAYYALRRFDIKRRTPRENSALLFSNKPLSFHIKTGLSSKERELKTLGTALYWGEGYKTEKSKTVDFANSDPAMIRVFLVFLRKICGIDEKRLRILLYCHNNPSVHIRYWSAVTSIHERQFTKPYVAERTSIKGKGMPHGLIHVRYSDKKLLDLIRSWIQESAGRYCVDTEVVKRGTL